MDSPYRYLRSISNEYNYLNVCDPESLERLLQMDFSLKNSGKHPDGSLPLQTSWSVYRIEAEPEDQSFRFAHFPLARAAVRHGATARLGKPNTTFLDITDWVDGRPCPQEDSDSPFEDLKKRHHSLKFNGDSDTRQWVYTLCQGIRENPEAIYHLELADLQLYLQKVELAQGITQEWRQAAQNLREHFEAKNMRSKNYSFWTRNGLL